MDSAECSTSNSVQLSGEPSASAAAWAKLVPADSAYPEVAVAEDDAVVCSLTTAAGEEKLAWCEIRRGGDAASATIRNLSPGTIIVDGKAVQQEAVDIKTGSEIVSGPQREDVRNKSPWHPSNQDTLRHLVYIFEITAAKDHEKNNIKIVLDVENAKCSICLNVWHDVVTAAPCFHNFCNGCFSEWLRRSSNKSRDKTKSAVCPQCRTTVQSVGRNHFLRNVEEAILQAFSSLQRSDEDIALLESYASVKTNLTFGRQKKQSRKRSLSISNDGSNSTDLPCPQCGTEFGGFRCSQGAAHLQCHVCGGMMPARHNPGVPQKCLGCDRAFCGAYWCSQGVDSSQYSLICNQATFRTISQRHISRLPDTVHENNPYEKDITERCIQQSGKTLQAVISEWVAKFDNKELDCSRLKLNHADTLNSRTHVCNDCYNIFIDFLMYWYRVTLPINLLPPDAANRDSCWYGYVCRTQHHRPDHARRLNHVCRPTRGNS